MGIKITQLPTLNTADIQSNDRLVIVDVSDISSSSTGTTKQLSPDAFVQPDQVYLTSDFISSSSGQDGVPVVTSVDGRLDPSLLNTDAIEGGLDALNAKFSDYYLKSEFISEFTGSPNQPIITNLNGLIPPDLVDILTFRFIDSFTPSGGDEYPDTTGQTAGTGGTWIVEGLTAGGYTFAGGDLAGLTVYNDAWMVYGELEWILMHNVPSGSTVIWGSITGTLSDQTDLNNALGLKTDDTAFTAHTGNFLNPHQVDADDVGLGSVDNTSDANKPISDATQTALDEKQPVLDGSVTGQMQYWTGSVWSVVDATQMKWVTTGDGKFQFGNNGNCYVSGTSTNLILSAVSNMIFRTGGSNGMILDGSALYWSTTQRDLGASYAFWKIGYINQLSLTQQATASRNNSIYISSTTGLITHRDGSGGVGTVQTDTGSPTPLHKQWSGTQAEYDGLTPDPNTLYFITA